MSKFMKYLNEDRPIDGTQLSKAAPDLLTALQALLKLFDSKDLVLTFPNGKGVKDIIAARAAIARATRK